MPEQTELDHIHKEVAGIGKTINGNGTEGLKTIVAGHAATLKDILKALESITKSLQGLDTQRQEAAKTLHKRIDSEIQDRLKSEKEYAIENLQAEKRMEVEIAANKTRTTILIIFIGAVLGIVQHFIK